MNCFVVSIQIRSKFDVGNALRILSVNSFVCQSNIIDLISEIRVSMKGRGLVERKLSYWTKTLGQLKRFSLSIIN